MSGLIGICSLVDERAAESSQRREHDPVHNNHPLSQPNTHSRPGSPNDIIGAEVALRQRSELHVRYDPKELRSRVERWQVQRESMEEACLQPMRVSSKEVLAEVGGRELHRRLILGSPLRSSYSPSTSVPTFIDFPRQSGSNVQMFPSKARNPPDTLECFHERQPLSRTIR